MLYPQNKNDRLEDALFQNPGSEYRGTPFWAWNSTLAEEQLMEQIDYFKEMGFGGFHMHVRQGLETEYMGPEFMDAVKACVNKAQKEGMYAWLYDEDRWPSGCAGGKVTTDIRYRLRYLLMTKQKIEDCTGEKEEAYTGGKPLFLGAFQIKVNQKGYVTKYEKAAEGADGPEIRFFYCMTKMEGEPRYNFQTYVDTMSKDAIDSFIQVTHEAYKEEIGEAFGQTVPAIFTDEPQMMRAVRLESSFSDQDAILPFTIDFPETFREENGYDLTERLPELFFADRSKQARKTKYDYYRHASIRFHSAFADNIGKWCQENNIMLTGHAMGEDSLEEMVEQGYETMRLYKEMELPGIDMLFDDRAFTTAIQCRSAVRQYGREGMMSELYGVTGWDFDFRGHKFQGDWQACMGVTVRVPHLAWQTMKGEGKRDYPASLFYQSPWYREYKYLEDHYARIAAALTRGKAVVKVGVIHPVESYWLERASNAETMPVCREYEEHFKELADWLIRGQIDFDYLSQSQLPELCKETGAPLKVGQALYDVVIACDCTTLRAETIALLEGFTQCGGKLIVMGKKPVLCDGVESSSAVHVAEKAVCLPYSKTALLEELEAYRDVEIRNGKHAMVNDLMYTMREDNGRKWLFIAQVDKPRLRHTVNKKELVIKVKGAYKPALYNTLTGEIGDVEYQIRAVDSGEDVTAGCGQEPGACAAGCGMEMSRTETWVFTELYDTDSLLLAFDPAAEEESGAAVSSCPRSAAPQKTELDTPYAASYTLAEPNVLLLDMAEYRVNGGQWNKTEEIMRIDEAVRAQLGLQTRRTKVVQPYVIKDVPEPHTLELRYTIVSEEEFENVKLAMENPEKCEIIFNDERVENSPVGYYVDKDIKTIELGRIKEGENTIYIKMPFGLRTDLEACYLLGAFGTKYCGRQQFLCKLPKKLCFGSAVHQGFAFYGGNITYHTEAQVEESCDLEIEMTNYAGALVKVTLDGKETKRLIFSPYKVTFENVTAGKHTISYELFGNRYNTFSALHTLLSNKERVYMGPDYWRSKGDGWAYEYQTRPFGILKSPIIRKIVK